MSEKYTKWHNKTYYKKIIVSYIIIIAFFVPMSLIVYFGARYISVSNEISSAEKYINVVMSVADEKLVRVRDDLLSILDSVDKLNKDSYTLNGAANYEYVNVLGRYSAEWENAAEFYLFDQNYDFIYHNSGTIGTFAFNSYVSEGDVNVVDRIKESKNFDYIPLIEKETNQATQLCFVGNNYYEEKDIKSIIKINMDDLVNIHTDNNPDSGCLLVVNSEGVVISNNSSLAVEVDSEFMTKMNGNETHFFAGDKFFVCHKSNLLDWTYVMCYEKNYINAIGNKMRNIHLMFMFVALVFGFLFAVRSSRAVYSPIEKILKKIGSETERDRTDEFEFIDSFFEHLTTENQKYHDSLNLYNLVNGKSGDFKTVDISYNYYRGIIIKGVRIEDYVKYFDDYAEKNNGHLYFRAIQCNREEIIALVGTNDDNCSAVVKYFDIMLRELSQEFGIKSMIGIGTAVRDKGKISDSINEAIRAFYYGESEYNKDIYVFENTTPVNYIINIDKEVFENGIVLAIKSGNRERIEEILSKVLSDNKDIPNFYKFNLAMILLDSYCRISVQLLKEQMYDLWPLMQEFRNEYDLDVYRCVFSQMFSALIDEKQDMKKEERIEAELKEYVLEHYSDAGLSIGQLAEHIGYSEAYTIKLFKNVMGVSFTQYIVNLRIEKAMQMLKNTNDNIDVVAEKNGFATYNNFAKLFRSKTGMSPSDYRKMK